GRSKYGTGYCDAQCHKDIKPVNGVANSQGWYATILVVFCDYGTNLCPAVNAGTPSRFSCVYLNR
ncbi:hypothetical protein B0H14DRAFT_2902863, partial [Mycena olivaceomarginata]